MRKKVYFSEIVFTNEYYIDGVNILDDRNIEYLGNIDIDLKVNLSFSKIDNAKLVKIKDLNIDIVIAEVKDFKIICYLKSNLFRRICNDPRHQLSVFNNYYLLEEYTISKIKKLSDDNIVYSPDYKTRGYISNKNGLISLKYQRLEIEDEIGFYFNENVNSNNFWSWEDLSGISYFDTIENAKKEAETYLANYVHEPNELYVQQYKTLWQYSLNKVNSWLYQMKFACLGIFIFPLSMMIFPILGLSNWNIMWLFGGCIVFSLILGGSVLWFNVGTISYEISDKGICAFKGIVFQCSYDNIKSVRIKKNIFNKNKGSIKFKLHKGLAVNYNFDNIENPEKAYKIIKEQMKL